MNSNTVNTIVESIINVSKLVSGFYFVKIEGANLSNKLMVDYKKVVEILPFLFLNIPVQHISNYHKDKIGNPNG